ncbi:hypothetical protein P171DRAFT_432576 [Karstenula rhodostoma CBS 690.94]|uniref:F-box domain-containing protein n=1 Tax=Karstenula rhodostoma CBS 690.94 TaxID=1392251 RepID=A0A9P4PFX3_9PLEO|nr:hypothetical protein P171DRAFT_432576 [Karstenula rhodostoma CBS 690.94]
MAAASTVFGSPEILQQILSELPAFDIIRYQRVSRVWHKLIADSPLLQYKSWLRNEYPDPAQHVRDTDFIPWDRKYPHGSEAARDHETKRYLSNITRHLNPIIVGRALEDIPRNAGSCFDPIQDMDKDGFGGYFNFRPVHIQALCQWYEANKDTESRWGHLSLYRPETRKISWDVPCTDDSGLPFSLKAKSNDDPDYTGNGVVVVNKRPGEPLFLTVGDLLANVGDLWEKWLDYERETHYLSHDGEGCDSSLGLPDDCISFDDNEDQEEDSKENKVLGTDRHIFEGISEYYIERCIRIASD